MSANTAISNVMAGGLMAVINITVAISVAALIFAGTRPEYFATGVAVMLIATVVGGLGGTIGSGFGGVVMGPRSGLAPVFAGMVASLIVAVPAGPMVMPTILMTIMITCLVAGAVLFGLGLFRLGGLVRYIPYPVMGGFFAGIGLIFVRGGIGVASGEAVNFANAGAFLDPDILALAVPAVVFAVTLYAMQRVSNHWAVFPSVLVVAFALFYTMLGVFGITLDEAAAGGWLPDIAAMSVRLPIFAPADLARVDWGAVLSQSGAIATVAFLTSIMLLLDTSGVEIITGRELNPNRELRIAGLTNILNGFVVGYPSVHAASDTAFTYKLGGDRRMMGFVYAAVVILAIAAGTGFIGSMPKYILGGLLIYVGIDFLIDWTWRTRRDMPILDYAMILLILAVIAFFGILQGVAFGFMVAIVLFVISYSRLSVIKSDLSGREHASHVDRDVASRRVLDRRGGEIYIVRLQGFIFFGTADSLFTDIRERVEKAAAEGEPVRFLVLDFLHVSELDTSAVRAFVKLAQYAENAGMSIAVTDITEKSLDRLAAVDFLTSPGADAPRLRFDHLDDGVAWAEDRILDQEGGTARGHAVGDVADRLAELLGDTDAATRLAPYFETLAVGQGEYLFRQGDPGDSLYVLDSGAAAVVIVLDDSRERSIRIFEEGTVLGEMALYTQAPRSAGVRMERNGTLFRLPVDRFHAMQTEEPAAAGLFHSFVVRLLAERLDRANRELRHYA